MTISYGVEGALDYSVFIGSAAGFILATIPVYKYSLDELLKTSLSTVTSNKNSLNASSFISSNESF